MLTLIAAMDVNRAIGRNGEIPWDVPEDMRFFKSLTTGYPVIMGRKTWDSLPNGPLKDRTNVVVTRSDHGVREGAIHCSVDQAMDVIRYSNQQCGFCIGGGELYRAMMPLASRIVLSVIETEVDGADAWFPVFEQDGWQSAGRAVLRESGPRCVTNIYTRAAGADISAHDSDT